MSGRSCSDSSLLILICCFPERKLIYSRLYISVNGKDYCVVTIMIDLIYNLITCHDIAKAKDERPEMDIGGADTAICFLVNSFAYGCYFLSWWRLNWNREHGGKVWQCYEQETGEGFRKYNSQRIETPCSNWFRQNSQDRKRYCDASLGFYIFHRLAFINVAKRNSRWMLQQDCQRPCRIAHCLKQYCNLTELLTCMISNQNHI